VSPANGCEVLQICNNPHPLAQPDTKKGETNEFKVLDHGGPLRLARVLHAEPGD
jgi:hypothetical protein